MGFVSNTKQVFWDKLFAPVDIAVLVFFRIAFGALMLLQVVLYFANNWIYAYFIAPNFFFPYYGFEWVKPWPGDLMYLHFIVLGILAVFILIGFQYRISMALFFLGFTYFFLLDHANFLNHFYLILLISFLMIFVPAHRAFSIDAWRRKEIRTDTVPSLSLWILKAQIGIVYFYGGIAKLNPDWLFRAEPMRVFLNQKMDFPLIGPLFSEEWIVWSFNYSSFLLDLLVVPFLLWRKTRWYAVGIAVTFHLLNSQLFSIAIFPWFMIVGTLLFLEPHWPRRVLSYFLKKRNVGTTKPNKQSTYEKRHKWSSRQRTIILLLMIYFIFQLSVPLRHYLYPGNTMWTEEGDYFSWHMMLDSTAYVPVEFYVTDPASSRTWQVGPDLTPFQLDRMNAQAYMILQYSHHIADVYREQGYDEVEVRVETMMSLNSREFQKLIDPTVDLAAQPVTLLPATWIIPLKPLD